MSIPHYSTMQLATIFLVIVSASLTSGQLPALSYSELVSRNVSCSPRDTCIRELSKSRDLPTLVDRNCACDSVCATYGDCCIDAPARTKATSSKDVGGWICRNLTQFGGIIMKNACPANWAGTPEVRQLCESESNVEQDPFSAMPITNKLTGTTYSNFYCAVCNGDTTDSLIWLPRLEFNTLSQYNNTYGNITSDYIKHHIEYIKAEKTWGLRLRGDDGVVYTHPAKLYPMIPMEVETLVRSCRKSLISTCDPTWLDQEVKEKCDAYEAAIYVHDLSKNVGYKNPHCAFCNYVQPSQLVCKPPSAKSDVEQRTFNFQALSVIVDFNDAKGNQVGQNDLCYDGEIYDPFQKKCRNVVCGFPGYVLEKNKCVLRRITTTTPDPTTTSSTSTTTMPTTTSTTSTTTSSTTSTTSSTTTPSTTSTTSSTTLSTTTTSSTEIPSISSSTNTSTTTSTEATAEQTNSTVDTTTSTPRIETKVLPLDPLKYDTFTTEETDLEVVTLSRNSSETSRREEKSDSSSNSMSEDTTSADSNPGSYYSQEFIECPKVPVPPENVQALPNGTIYIVPYDRYYEPYHYLFASGQVLVCAFFINDTQTEEAKFSIVLGYITVVGLSISMFCLVLHLIAFFIVPDLQNLSTRNLSSYSLALFFAYFCFTISNISALSKVSCTTLAVTTCYFFLVSFFWMNTMSYDVWRTLRLATQELRVSSGKQWKRFLGYSLYAWGIPAGIVTTAVVIDNVGGVPSDYKPGFGARAGFCWFSERKPLLIFFASPLIAIMIVNIGFFISSAKMILSTSHTTANNYSTTSRRNFKLYLRLGVMMGLTWTFGVIAGYLDLETLWYVFIIFNTLQGLFIFVAFTCNRKVRKYLFDRFQAIRKGRQAYRTSSLNSGSGFNSNSTFPSSNNSASKTMSSQLNDTKTTLMSPEKSPAPMSPLTCAPERSITSFKHLQAGMETLY